MGGDMQQFFGEALAKGGEIGLQAAVQRKDAQRKLGEAIWQNLAATGQFNNLPPSIHAAVKKEYGEPILAGLSQLSKINEGRAMLQAGAMQSLQQPVMEEISFEAPAPPAQPDIAQYLQQQPTGPEFTPVELPQTVTRTAIQQRPPTPKEMFLRSKEDAAAANLVVGTDYSSAILNEMNIKHEQAKLVAKTAQHKEAMDMFIRLSGSLDGADPMQGAGPGGMFVKSINYNSDGTFSWSSGPRSNEDVRSASNQQLRTNIADGLAKGYKPIDIVYAEQAKGNFWGTHDDIKGHMQQTAKYLITQFRQQGMPLDQAVDQAQIMTGEIPAEFADYLPQNVITAANIRAAQNGVDATSKLTDLYKRSQQIDIELKAQELLTQKLVENSARPLTPAQIDQRTTNHNAMSQLVKLHNNFKPAFVGIGRGRIPTNIGNMLGIIGMTEADFRAQVMTLQSTVIKAITGAQMSASEARRILAAVPELTDSGQNFLAKLRLMMHNQEQLISLSNTMEMVGNKRWTGDAKFTTINVNGVAVTVFDDSNSSLLDPSRKFSFSETFERAAGLAFDPQSGTMINVRQGQPGPTAPQPSEASKEFDSIMGKEFGIGAQ
jgi:hypothetical protein